MLKIITLLSFSLIFCAPSVFAKNVCKDNRETFLRTYDELYTQYKNFDAAHVMNEHKKAVWIEGDPKVNKAVFVAHGYMGTPAEMMYIVEPLKKQGWSVIGFLIPGHGATYEIANGYKNTVWVDEMKKHLELATSCFTEVRAIGFSTGGLLLHHYLMTNKTPSSLKSLHLISPYFLQRFGGSFDRILGSLFNGLSVETAYFISRFRDLKVMTIDKENYNQHLPVEAGLQIKDLGLKVYHSPKNTTAGIRLQLPVQLFLSEGDWTVDTDATKQVINREYENVQLVWYKGEEPHHLMCPSVSKVAPEIQRLISTFKL